MGGVGHQDFRETLAEELDFEQEARNAERCRRDLEAVPGVTVPHIHTALSTKRVLTTEFIHGCKGDDLKVRGSLSGSHAYWAEGGGAGVEAQAMRAMQLDVAVVARMVVTAFAHQIFRSGFVHSDPHPGNVLVRRGRNGQPEVVVRAWGQGPRRR
jgi:aarF domain-containing kinase